jgi:hypothetical protein
LLIVMPKQILLIVLAILFAQLLWAQQIHKQADEKGRLQYSDFPPPRLAAEDPATSDVGVKTASQTSDSSTGEQRRAEDNAARSTPGVLDNGLDAANRGLLALPPSDPNKPLSEWIPVKFFPSVEECARARDLLITDAVMQSRDFSRDRRTSVDFGPINSRCISLAEFKPSKEPNVIVTITNVGPDPGGFSAWVLHGRVFNRGQTTAQKVVVRYRIRDARGIIYASGEIPTAPQDVTPLMFGEFRGQILGPLGGSDRWVETEARWLKD